MKQCSVDGCAREADYRSLCRAHMSRLKRLGTVLATVPIAPSRQKQTTNLQWLKNHASHSGKKCLLWPFGKFANGYGQVCIKRVNKVASREMCVLAHGEPPSPEHEAAHSCGNGHLGCVNPRHLRWATPTENASDKSLHRTVRGPEAVRLCA